MYFNCFLKNKYTKNSPEQVQKINYIILLYKNNMKRTNIFPNKFKVINGKIPKYYQYQSIWFFFFFRKGKTTQYYSE
jgi:hypothetical protein